MRNILRRSALGAKVPHYKGTASMQTEEMPLPSKIVLPMSQHIGAPCEVCVAKGDKVKVGTVVGKAGGFVSADIHSGVSGEVSAVDSIMLANGNIYSAVVIIPDGKQEISETVKPPEVTDRESFVAAVRQSGLVGLGGAGFPTAVKLSPKNLDEIDTLVINGAECEPYITADHREFIENGDDVIEGICAVKKYLGIKKAVIGIERNKPDAIDAMFSLTKGDDSITVKPLPSKYPQGAEKILIERCTGREVPRGGLPSDVGVIVMNVASVAFVARYLKTGMPLTTKRLTVDGDIVNTPKNVRAVIGTPCEEVLDFCGGLKEEAAKVLFGGPMMGSCLCGLDFPIMKQTNAILAFGEKKAHIPNPQPCIRCGRCINACPMGLSPVEIAEAYKADNKEGLIALKADLCMDCGSCSFVCPAKRPVSQTMRLAKSIMPKKGGAK